MVTEREGERERRRRRERNREKGRERERKLILSNVFSYMPLPHFFSSFSENIN